MCSRKAVAGKSERKKIRLAQEITHGVMSLLNYGAESVSVAFEEVDSEDWAGRFYRPDIQGKWDTLYKKPEYTV